jgi:chromosome segregation protein
MQAQVEGERERAARRAAGQLGHVAGLESQVQAAQQQLAGHQNGIERIEKEIARRNERVAQLEQDVSSVDARLEAVRRELDVKSGELGTAQEDLEPARGSLQQLESRQRTINDELSAARSRALEAERALLEAESTVRLRIEELDSLRARLEEEGFRPSDEGELVVAEEVDGPPSWLVSERRDDEGLPPIRGGARVDVTALRDRVSELRAGIRRLGPVNEQAAADFAESSERYTFLSTQLKDLREAEASLLEAIEELEGIIKERFSSTFQKVNGAFRRYFETFFGGGHAELQLTKPDEQGLPGIDILAQPPRKRVRSIQMLSGGERSLTAVALLFALLDTHPSPICVLDEVDAALDEANVSRFTGELSTLAQRTQFIIITHNRRTLEMADTIYGISMGEDSTSSVLSLRLGDIPAK